MASYLVEFIQALLQVILNLYLVGKKFDGFLKTLELLSKEMTIETLNSCTPVLSVDGSKLGKSIR